MHSPVTPKRSLGLLLALALCQGPAPAYATDATAAAARASGPGIVSPLVDGDASARALEGVATLEAVGDLSEETALTSQGSDAADPLNVGIYAIQPSGNVILYMLPEDFLTHFSFGDVVRVAPSSSDHKIVAPVVTNYSDVDAFQTAVVVRPAKQSCTLAVNAGSFAETYGISDQTTFTITLDTEAGYADELLVRSLSYTDERDDYPQLSDEQFANFRVVATTGMGEGVLFRSASPVNPKHNRNTYADEALRAAEVRTVLNLADDEETLTSFAGYADSYYATCDHVAHVLGVAYTSPDNQDMLADELRFLAEHEGPYLVHCLEGEDRTGFVVALLECLMGADLDEVVEDYMVSYGNYYGVTAEDERYVRLSDGVFAKTLEHVFDVEDLATADLASEAREYLEEIGLTDEEISAVIESLSGQSSDDEDEEPTHSDGTAPDGPGSDGRATDGPGSDATSGSVTPGTAKKPDDKPVKGDKKDDSTRREPFATSTIAANATWSAKTPTTGTKTGDSETGATKPTTTSSQKAENRLAATADPTPSAAPCLAAAGVALATGVYLTAAKSRR